MKRYLVHTCVKDNPQRVVGVGLYDTLAEVLEYTSQIDSEQYTIEVFVRLP